MQCCSSAHDTLYTNSLNFWRIFINAQKYFLFLKYLLFYPSGQSQGHGRWLSTPVFLMLATNRTRSEQHHECGLTYYNCSCVLNISKNRNTPATMGNLFQYLITLRAKYFYLHLIAILCVPTCPACYLSSYLCKTCLTSRQPGSVFLVLSH